MHLVWVGILSVWSSIPVSIFGTVTVTVTPPSDPVLTGQTTVIGCSYTASAAGSRTNVFWNRQPDDENELIADHEVGSDTLYYGSQVGRLDMVGDTSLRISDTQLTDGGVYRCAVSVRGVGIGSGDVSVDPQALPSSPTITISPSSPSTLAPITLTGRTTGAFPVSTISWYRGDEDSPVAAAAQQDTQESDGTFTSTRTLTFTPTKADNGATYRCVVTHGALQGDLRSTTTLDVRYPAEISTAPPTTTPVIAGQSATLDCTADGNPDTFTYTWKEGNREIDTGTENQYSAADGVLTIGTVRKDQHDTQYSCEVTNNIGSPDTASTTLNVQYDPDVSSPPTTTVNETGDLTVVCQVTANPAASSVGWTKQGSSTSVADSATLSITSISRAAAGTYVCTAQNTFHESSTGTGTSSTVVTVQYAPSKSTITIDPSPVVENQTVTLMCSSDSALPDPSYAWKFTAQGQAEQDVSFGTTANNGATLTVINVQRAQAGQYRCTATNAVGSADSDVTELVVNYPASITFITPSVTVDEYDAVNLTCTADSNPEPAAGNFSWTYMNGTSLPVTVTSDGFNLTTTITAITYQQVGRYRCTAGNGIGPTVSAGTNVTVEYPPKFYPPPDPYPAAIGADVSMQCSAFAVPNKINFSWSRNGSTLTNSSRLTIQSSGETSVLTISSVVEWDYGTYNCTAKSEKGSATTTRTLQPLGPPDSPSALRVLSKNAEFEVRITWQAGFNGGLKTTHTAQLKRLGSDQWEDVGSREQTTSQQRRTFNVTVDLKAQGFAAGDYQIRIMASNTQGEALSDHVDLKLEGENKRLYGRMTRDEDWIEALKDTESTEFRQKAALWEKNLDRVFSSFVGYEGSTITQYSQGSIAGDFEAVVAQSETQDAIEAFRTQVISGSVGDLTVVKERSTITDQQSPVEGDNTTVIIIAVVCGVVVLAFIAVAVLFVRRRQSANKKSADNHPNNMELDQVPDATDDGYQSLKIPHRRKSDHTYQGLTAHSKKETIPEATYEDVKTTLEFPRNQLDIKEELGQGEFGNVYKAEAWKISGKTGVTTVAVKELKGLTGPAASAAFFKELSVLKLLGTHPNVVSFLGCCTDQEPFYLLLEFVPGGSLQSTLRTSRTQQTYGNLHGGSKSLSPRDLTKFAWDVAKGMSFLSSKKILHRDLATRNVLVSADRTCKVSDFGFSREGDEYERTTKTRLPVRWMAPESLFHRKYTTKSDVWAFGVLLWEIVTLGATPYPGMSKREVMDGVQQGYRMDKPHHCDDKLYALMLSCWDADPARRPEFRKIQRTLDTMMEDEHNYINLASLDENTYTSLQTATDEKY